MKFTYVAFTSHICTTFHYTNNTMAYNVGLQQNITPQGCLYFSTGKLGNLVFLLGKFDRLVANILFDLL